MIWELCTVQMSKWIRQNHCVTIGMSYGHFMSNNWIIYDDTIHSLIWLVYTLHVPTARVKSIHTTNQRKIDNIHSFSPSSSPSPSLSLFEHIKHSKIAPYLNHVRKEQTKRTTNDRMISRKRQREMAISCKACGNWSYRQNNCHDVSENKSKNVNEMQQQQQRLSTSLERVHVHMHMHFYISFVAHIFNQLVCVCVFAEFEIDWKKRQRQNKI